MGGLGRCIKEYDLPQPKAWFNNIKTIYPSFLNKEDINGLSKNSSPVATEALAYCLHCRTAYKIQNGQQGPKNG